MGMGARAVAAAVIGIVMSTAAAAGQWSDVCGRTHQVADAIVTASGAATCAHVTGRDLGEITHLDVRDRGLTSLTIGDFDGLVRLRTLDLSWNLLATVPPGVLDPLLLLETLHVDGNLLETFPLASLEKVYTLEKLSVEDNPNLTTPGYFPGHFAMPPWLVDAGSLDAFIGNATTAEEFINRLPALYKERFVLVYESESPAVDHTSGDYPRVISWGGDGRLIFSWNTDPATPAAMRNAIEFLRRGETEWTAGIVDFSTAPPTVTEPDACRTCHGPLNKPLWGAYNNWEGTEYVEQNQSNAVETYNENVVDSTDARIEPLDFSVSEWQRGHKARMLMPSFVNVVVEAGAVMAWRHAEVLLGRLQERDDYRSFAENTVCAGEPTARQRAALLPFSTNEHNPAVLATTGVPIQGGDIYSTFISPDYHLQPVGGELGGVVVFLIVVDLYEQEPIVRGLYRQTSASETLPASRPNDKAFLYHTSATATAEDELIAKVRLHFGAGTRSAVTDRDAHNGKWFRGLVSAAFTDGHLETMAPLVCAAVTQSMPRNLAVSVTDDDAELSWDEPEDTDALDGFSGYEVRRGLNGAEPARIAETGTVTSYTDSDLGGGDYEWSIHALFDDYPSPASNSVRATIDDGDLSITSPSSFTVAEGDTTVGTLGVSGTETPAWSTSGADAAHFTVDANGSLAFGDAKDYESPDDANADGTYDLTVEGEQGQRQRRGEHQRDAFQHQRGTHGQRGSRPVRHPGGGDGNAQRVGNGRRRGRHPHLRVDTKHRHHGDAGNAQRGHDDVHCTERSHQRRDADVHSESDRRRRPRRRRCRKRGSRELAGAAHCEPEHRPRQRTTVPASSSCT